MTKTTINKIKDGNRFRLAKYSHVTYEIILKKKGMVTYTSDNSHKSFIRPGSTPCYVS